MAKDSLWKYPVVKQFIERCGAYPVKRYRGVGLEDDQVGHITDLKDDAAVMCIYPEGTRNRKPEDIEAVQRNKLKTTIGWLALEYGIPIVPVGIAGPVKGRKFPRTLVFGEPIMPEPVDDMSESEFKLKKYELMDTLHSKMDDAYQTARQLHPSSL
jgi:1-acyl-sn-glycerol-3-phosphate acyltransferase